MSALWGPKALDNVIEFELHFEVEPEKVVLKRQGLSDNDEYVGTIADFATLSDFFELSCKNEIIVRGLTSKFAVGCGRSGTDRQFFFINGRPCNPSKVCYRLTKVHLHMHMFNSAN